MTEENKNYNFFKKIQDLIFRNYRVIIIIFLSIFFLFILFQIYNYLRDQEIKNTSISFFDIIQKNKEDLIDLETLIDEDNFFSVLSQLKLIQININKKNYSYSRELYKELIFSSDLNPLYKSAIAAHASYTFIDASYYKKSDIYLNDISSFINNINDELDGYFSIKKELQFMLKITEIDLYKSNYKNDSTAIELYESIISSDSISPVVKERVKKIHEYQLYK